MVNPPMLTENTIFTWKERLAVDILCARDTLSAQRLAQRIRWSSWNLQTDSSRNRRIFERPLPAIAMKPTQTTTSKFIGGTSHENSPISGTKHIRKAPRGQCLENRKHCFVGFEAYHNVSGKPANPTSGPLHD
jgi:hypothetical protein